MYIYILEFTIWKPLFIFTLGVVRWCSKSICFFLKKKNKAFTKLQKVFKKYFVSRQYMKNNSHFNFEVSKVVKIIVEREREREYVLRTPYEADIYTH